MIHLSEIEFEFVKISSSKINEKYVFERGNFKMFCLVWERKWKKGNITKEKKKRKNEWFFGCLVEKKVKRTKGKNLFTLVWLSRRWKRKGKKWYKWLYNWNIKKWVIWYYVQRRATFFLFLLHCKHTKWRNGMIMIMYTYFNISKLHYSRT